MELDLSRFFMWIRQVVSEFYVLNTHFETEVTNPVQAYEGIFNSWRLDMSKKYRQIMLHMHWATSSPIIQNNSVVLDVMHRSFYLFEINYRFGDELRPDFAEILKNFENAVDLFQAENKNFKVYDGMSRGEYENFFYRIKEKIQLNSGGLLVDITWDNEKETVSENTLFYNVIFQDLFLFRLKCVPEFQVKNGIDV